jgi:hypothetical protein
MILGVVSAIHILRLDSFFSGRRCMSNFRGDDILRPGEAPGDFRDCFGDSHPATRSLLLRTTLLEQLPQ